VFETACFTQATSHNADQPRYQMARAEADHAGNRCRISQERIEDVPGIALQEQLGTLVGEQLCLP
jgi:hypothetical protein